MGKILNARGQALVSNVIAASIVAVTAAGTASLVQYLTTQSRKSQTLNRAVILQSELTAALLRKDQYAVGRGDEARDGLIATIKSGTPPRGFAIETSAGQELAIVGEHYGYDREGGRCQGTDCAIYVDVDVRCDTGTSACMAAYRVTPSKLEGAVAPPPLGAPPHAGATSCGGVAGFACADYTVPISYDYFTQDASPKCEGDDVMISGVERTSGKLNCVKAALPTNACPEGTIAHNVKAVSDAGINGRRLELDCHPLARAACPAEYVFERLGVGQLDLGKGFVGNYTGYAAPDGLCRYRWRDNIAWQADLPRVDSSGGGATATSVVCNPNVYNATFSDGSSTSGGCGYVVTSSSPGHCQYSCNCRDDGQGGTTCDTCDSYPTSSIGVTDNSITGGTATCGITISHQCNSSMTAHPVASGRCRVKPPYLGALEVYPQWR